MNIALADEFKLFETYVLSPQTINWKLPSIVQIRKKETLLSYLTSAFVAKTITATGSPLHFFIKYIRRCQYRMTGRVLVPGVPH